MKLSWIVARLASAVMAACLVLGGLAITNTHKDANQACHAADDVANAMVYVLKDGQAQTRNIPAETLKEKQRKDALAFYDRSIKRLKDAQC